MILHTLDYIQNMIALRQLKFERAMDRWDIHEANIACAQKAYWEQELVRMSSPDNLDALKYVPECPTTDFDLQRGMRTPSE